MNKAVESPAVRLGRRRRPASGQTLRRQMPAEPSEWDGPDINWQRYAESRLEDFRQR